MRVLIQAYKNKDASAKNAFEIVLCYPGIRALFFQGIPVGISAGAAMVAVLRQASLESNKGITIVVIIPSYTERYLATTLVDKERKEALELPTHDIDERFL